MGKIILILVIITSCNQAPKEQTKPVSIIGTDNSNLRVESKPFANPALIYGTSFGNHFQTLNRLSRYKDMLAFTSTASRIKFGDSALLGFYRNDLKLDFDLGDLTAIERVVDTAFLIYAKASIIARRKIVIPILIENDSCKIIIYSLKNPFN